MKQVGNTYAAQCCKSVNTGENSSMGENAKTLVKKTKTGPIFKIDKTQYR